MEIETLFKTVMARHDGRCAICGCDEHVSIRHVVPPLLGGDATDPANMVVLCVPHALEWEQRLLRFHGGETIRTSIVLNSELLDAFKSRSLGLSWAARVQRLMLQSIAADLLRELVGERGDKPDEN